MTKQSVAIYNCPPSIEKVKCLIMRQSLRLGSISGIPVGLNWGLLLIAAFYVFNLAVGILPAEVPGASAGSYWFFAAIGVVAFFGSILAHELGHSIVAQRNGIKVRAITLWFLGGVAELEKEADDPGVEFRIAIAGPAVSVALAAAFGVLAFGVGTVFGGGLFAFTLLYLALVNGVLAVFNMIPAAPLDGGRVLASALWWRSKNRHTARATAAKAGEVFGTAMIIIGVIGIFTGAGTFVLAILGFFLRTAAGAERRRAEANGALSTANVATAMLPLVGPINRGITVAGLESMSTAYERPVAFPLWSPDGITGLVPSTAVNSTPPANRTHTFVEDIVVEWGDFTSARVEEKMEDVVDRARMTEKSHVLVYDGEGRQVGYLPLDGSLALAPA